MQLGQIDDEVKRHLMILLLTVPKQQNDDSESHIPLNYEEAMQMGAKDIEMVREDLHTYVDELAEEYKMQ